VWKLNQGREKDVLNLIVNPVPEVKPIDVKNTEVVTDVLNQIVKPVPSAQGKTDKCITHGGGPRCSQPDCKSSAKGKLVNVLHMEVVTDVLNQVVIRAP